MPETVTIRATCDRCNLPFTVAIDDYRPLCEECQEDEDNGVDDSCDE